jgi:hypothetical protein
MPSLLREGSQAKEIHIKTLCGCPMEYSNHCVQNLGLWLPIVIYFCLDILQAATNLAW